jgi:hypothetical protein
LNTQSIPKATQKEIVGAEKTLTASQFHKSIITKASITEIIVSIRILAIITNALLVIL